MTNHEWRANSWLRKHASHGTFFVTVFDNGTANCSRVYGDRDPFQVEDLAPTTPFANVALAMMRCEERIAELDKLMMDQTIADLRAYAEKVA